MNEADQIYHDTEWVIPVYDDRQMFEHLTLEYLQCGLSWDLMLKKRQISFFLMLLNLMFPWMIFRILVIFRCVFISSEPWR